MRVKLTTYLSRILQPRRTMEWLLWGVLIGLFSGLVAITFFLVLELASHLVSQLTGFFPPAPAGEGIFAAEAHPGASGPELRLWLLALFPALGGLVSGLLVYTFAPEAEGHGTDAMIHAFHHKKGRIGPVVPAIKGAATVATLATGGSAGREGPIAQIGAGLGSWIAQKLELRPRATRTMLLAGAAGGLGAIFRAPLGGAMTAIEVLYREDFESDALIPCIISSVSAYTLFSAVFGHETIFSLPRLSFARPIQLPFYLLLALLCIPVGALYTRVFYGARDHLFRKLPLPRQLCPAIGGLLVGGLVLLCPQVYGAGWGYLQEAIDGNLSLGLMLRLSFLKILATTATISSGGSGGVFGPTLLIGGMLGGVMGYGAHALWPGVVDQPAAFVLVGMAALFAGVAHAPIGALLMITEMSGGYALVPPLMTVSACAILFMRRWSLYENQVENRFHSPAHLSNMILTVLRRLRVRDALDPERRPTLLPAATPLRQIRQVFDDTQELAYPVVDATGALLGTITLRRIRSVFHDPHLDTILIAEDLITEKVRCHPRENLHQVLSRMMESRCDLVPVVDPGRGEQVVGMLSQGDITAAYHRAMLRDEPTGAFDVRAIRQKLGLQQRE